MEIAMVTEDGTQFGGGPHHVQMLGERLVERGHDVTVFAPAGGRPERIGQIKDAGMNLRTFPAKKGLLNFFKARIPLTPLLDLRDYDVVHSHSFVFLGLLSSRSENFFLTTHGLRTSAYHQGGIAGYLFHKAITESGLRSANEKGAIICVSKHDLKQCRELGFQNSHYCPNGVNFEEIQEADGKRFRDEHGIEGLMVLELARFAKLKGQLRFVRDCAERIREKLDVTFVFAGASGSDRYMRRLRNEIKERNLKARIITDLSDEEMYRAHSAADVTVLPSEYEGQPITLSQSAAAGAPSVATDVGGVKEFTKDYCRVVPYWNSDKFTGEVLRLLKDDSLRRELGRNAVAHAREMSWSRVADFAESIYEKALARSLG